MTRTSAFAAIVTLNILLHPTACVIPIELVEETSSETSSELHNISTAPPLGNWTPIFSPNNTACSCEPGQESCHTLYRGRTISIVENDAILEFRKVTNGPPSTDIQFWIADSPSDHPSCTSLNLVEARTTGTWPEGELVLQTEVNIWATNFDLETAPCGDIQRLFLITGGGGGYEDQRIWFQEQAITFIKTCD